MTSTPEPLSPSTIALSPEGRLSLVYDVSADLMVGDPDALGAYVTQALNSGIYAVVSGQADGWAQGHRFQGYEILLSTTAPEPPFVADFLAKLPTQFEGRDIRARWNRLDAGDPKERLAAVEQAIAALLQPAAQHTGHGVLLWATHVGDYRLAGLQAFTSADFDNAPYDGPMPENLDGGVAAHKLCYYEATGRAWLSLQFTVMPDGTFTCLPDTESVNPWARPIPDEAWDAERKLFPTR